MKVTAIITLAVILPLSAFAATEATDTVAVSHDLEEVVVVGERAWIEGNKAIFVPSKSEKNLSSTPEDLVKRMHIPTVIVDGGAIKNLRGQNVPIFINGVPADNIDRQTFWPKQTYRVEYIDHPDDPKFRGADAVLNFIMTEYEVGGVTKTNLYQEFPNNGRYNITSKLVYKKMTFGALVGGGYNRDHRTSYDSEENYKGIWYDGDFYENIRRSANGHSWTRNENVDAALNAKYRTDNVQISHNVGLKWNRNPGSGSESSDKWSPSLFDSDYSLSTNKSRSLSPQLSGSYAYWTQKYGISGGWTYSNAHSNTSSLYSIGTGSDITNATEDDVNSVKANFSASYMLIPKKMSIGLIAGSRMDWFRTQYTGSANTLQRQCRGATDASLSLRAALNDKISFSAAPGFIVDYWYVYGHETHSQISPKAEVNLYWAPSRKFTMQGMVLYWSNAPSAAQSGDVIIRQDELTWLASNPNLKNFSSWTASVYCTWLASSWFSASAVLGYHRHNNDFMTIFESAGAERGGIIKTYFNAGPEDDYQLDLMLNGDFFDNKLNIHLQPVFSYTKDHGEYKNSMPWFRMRGGISYDMGNFSVSAYYSSPQKWMMNGGMTTSWSQEYLNLSCDYGNGNIFVSLEVGNIFNTHAKEWSKIRSGFYDYLRNSYSTGRNVNIRFSYTFGYGKKVDRNIDISAPSEIKSGALGSM